MLRPVYSVPEDVADMKNADVMSAPVKALVNPLSSKLLHKPETLNSC